MSDGDVLECEKRYHKHQDENEQELYAFDQVS